MPSPQSLMCICNQADDFKRPQTTFLNTGTEIVWNNTDGATFVCGDAIFRNYGYLYQSQTSVRHDLISKYNMEGSGYNGFMRCKVQTGTAGASNENVVIVCPAYWNNINFVGFFIGKDGVLYRYNMLNGTPTLTSMATPGIAYNSTIQWAIEYTNGTTGYVWVNGVRYGNAQSLSYTYRSVAIIWNLCTGYVSDLFTGHTHNTRNNFHTTFYSDEYSITPSPVVNSIRNPGGISSRIQTSGTDNRTVTVNGTFLEGTSDVGWSSTTGWANPMDFVRRCAENNVPVYIRTPVIETAGIIKTFNEVKYTAGASRGIGKFSVTLIEFTGGFKRS